MQPFGGDVRPAGAATVLAVVAAVVVVSLPRLQAFAIGENESEAAVLTRALGLELAAHAGHPPTLRALVEGCGLDPGANDLDWLDGGRLLRRHGYIFEVTGDGVRAWPWTYGDTGRAAYAFHAKDGVLRHQNGAGSWTGPERPPVVSGAGWSGVQAAPERF